MVDVREHDYIACQDGNRCLECKEHEKQEKILQLLAKRRPTVAGKKAVIQMLQENKSA